MEGSIANITRMMIKRSVSSILVWAVILGIIGFSVKTIPDSISVSHDAGGRKLPIYCVKTEKKKVALSFDAAWGNEDTKEIMKILKKHKAHVTFFMTGGWVDSFPEDVKMLYEQGHELGNHSENHKNMSQLSCEEMRREIELVHEKVKKLTGYEMKVFRPPYGDYSNEVIKNVIEEKYFPIQWSVDSLDWKDYGKDAIIDTVINHKALKSGAIILCHNGAKYTASALDELLSKLEEKGFEIVPVGKLIYTEKYHIDQAGCQIAD